MQKIKEKLHIGRNKHDNEYEAREGATAYDSAYATDSVSTGSDVVERPIGVGVAEVPVVVTEQERVGHRHGEGVVERQADEVCGVKTFTEVEDRPIVKERVERILEHRPVEKQYEVETRFVGERAVPSATGATVIDTDERIVEAAEPGPKCPVGAGQMMDQVIGGMGGTTGTTGSAYDPNLGAGTAYDANRRI